MTNCGRSRVTKCVENNKERKKEESLRRAIVEHCAQHSPNSLITNMDMLNMKIAM